VILFFFLAIALVASAITVVAHPNPIYSALTLVNALFLIAVMFVLLDAHMIAALQVIVYAGAIMVLFLFVIMLLGLETEDRDSGRLGLRGVAVVGGAVLAVQLAALSAAASAKTPAAGVAAGYGSTESLAERLFEVHVLPFELTSVLLLVAIVGAMVMARRRV